MPAKSPRMHMVAYSCVAAVRAMHRTREAFTCTVAEASPRASAALFARAQGCLPVRPHGLGPGLDRVSVTIYVDPGNDRFSRLSSGRIGFRSLGPSLHSPSLGSPPRRSWEDRLTPDSTDAPFSRAFCGAIPNRRLVDRSILEGRLIGTDRTRKAGAQLAPHQCHACAASNQPDPDEKHVHPQCTGSGSLGRERSKVHRDTGAAYVVRPTLYRCGQWDLCRQQQDSRDTEPSPRARHDPPS